MNSPHQDQGLPGKPATGEVWSRNPKHVADLDISPADEGCIVNHPKQDKLHFLNPTAVVILELCTGENSPQQIADLVKQAYGLAEAPVDDVRQALKQLKEDGLLL